MPEPDRAVGEPLRLRQRAAQPVRVERQVIRPDAEVYDSGHAPAGEVHGRPLARAGGGSARRGLGAFGGAAAGENEDQRDGASEPADHRPTIRRAPVPRGARYGSGLEPLCTTVIVPELSGCRLPGA